MKLPPKLEKATDFIGMLVALVVDLALNLTCFLVLAPDVWTAVAFACMGVMIVLFVFKSWSKGQKFAWLIFVAIVFFFDYSFVLEATRMQTIATETLVERDFNYAEDFELKRIIGHQEKTAKALEDLQLQYDKAMKRETLEELDSQIATKQAEASSYENLYQERLQILTKNQQESAKHVKITSAGIFNAIPTAFQSKRYLELVIYGLMFFGLQLIIVTSIEPPVKSKKKTQKRKTTILGLVELWVRAKKPRPRSSYPLKDPPAYPLEVPAAAVPAKPVAPIVAPLVPEESVATAKPSKSHVAAVTWQQILTPIRDNELKAPDAIAYETGATIDSVLNFLKAVAQIKGPAGRELIYSKNDKWYLAYTKDLVISAVQNNSKINTSLKRGI